MKLVKVMQNQKRQSRGGLRLEDAYRGVEREEEQKPKYEGEELDLERGIAEIMTRRCHEEVCAPRPRRRSSTTRPTRGSSPLWSAEVGFCARPASTEGQGRRPVHQLQQERPHGAGLPPATRGE